jgi:hypothetical protein
LKEVAKMLPDKTLKKLLKKKPVKEVVDYLKNTHNIEHNQAVKAVSKAYDELREK